MYSENPDAVSMRRLLEGDSEILGGLPFTGPKRFPKSGIPGCDSLIPNCEVTVRKFGSIRSGVMCATYNISAQLPMIRLASDIPSLPPRKRPQNGDLKTLQTQKRANT
jgi:hypothetical protein